MIVTASIFAAMATIHFNLAVFACEETDSCPIEGTDEFVRTCKECTWLRYI